MKCENDKGTGADLLSIEQFVRILTVETPAKKRDMQQMEKLGAMPAKVSATAIGEDTILASTSSQT